MIWLLLVAVVAAPALAYVYLTTSTIRPLLPEQRDALTLGATSLARITESHPRSTLTTNSRSLELTIDGQSRLHRVLATPTSDGFIDVLVTTSIHGRVPARFALRASSTTKTVYIGSQQHTYELVELDEGAASLTLAGHDLRASTSILAKLLVPGLLQIASIEQDARRARVSALWCTSDEVAIGLSYPARAIPELDRAVLELARASSEVEIAQDSPAEFWRSLYFDAPRESDVATGAIANLMRVRDHENVRLDVHDHILAHGGPRELETLYSFSTFPFFSALSYERLVTFIAGQIHSRRFEEDKLFEGGRLPEAAWNRLDARSLTDSSLTTGIRMRLFDLVVERDPEDGLAHLAEFFAALDENSIAFTLHRWDQRDHSLHGLMTLHVLESEMARVPHDRALAYCCAKGARDALDRGSIQWSDSIERALARLTFAHEYAARVAADVLIERGGAVALDALSSLAGAIAIANAPHAQRAYRALGKNHTDRSMMGALTVSADEPSHVGALTETAQTGDISLLTTDTREDA